MSTVPASTLPQNRTLTGKSCRAAACAIRSRPGSFGARFASFVSMMRMPTAPGVFFQSAMTSATAGSSGLTGLTMAIEPHDDDAHARRRQTPAELEVEGEDERARDAGRGGGCCEAPNRERRLEAGRAGRHGVGQAHPFGVCDNLRHTRELERE